MEKSISLYPVDIERIASLCGSCNENINLMAKRLEVNINHRGHIFHISGSKARLEQAKNILLTLYEETKNSDYITKEDVHINLQHSAMENLTDPPSEVTKQNNKISIVTPKQTINFKGDNQRKYITSLYKNDIQFVIGPAGTGKTYLAVAYAIQALKQKKILRINLVRPAVESGETLGFLPGNLVEKIDPYLRPLYDALYGLMGYEETINLINKNIIEISPLAYMRGRTLNNCIVILDEAQNSSREQMKMFLTRLGHNSKAIITGDITQIDLPLRIPSGLIQAIDILKDIKGIGISRLDARDVVRHPLLTKIINAYERNQDKASS